MRYTYLKLFWSSLFFYAFIFVSCQKSKIYFNKLCACCFSSLPSDSIQYCNANSIDWAFSIRNLYCFELKPLFWRVGDYVIFRRLCKHKYIECRVKTVKYMFINTMLAACLEFSMASEKKRASPAVLNRLLQYCTL